LGNHSLTLLLRFCDYTLDTSIYSLLSTNAIYPRQAVEAYGIFSIGEMIGRRNVVGYKLKD